MLTFRQRWSQLPRDGRDTLFLLGTVAWIILPLSAPALITVAIFTFVWSWNDFFGQLLVLGVGLLRPVQCDPRDRAFLLIDDSFTSLVEVHAVSLTFQDEVMTPISAPMS